MAGAGLSLEAERGARRLDPGREPRRVELLRRGSEEELDPRGGGVTLVGDEVVRVGVEVGLLGELGRVHEHARDHAVVLGPRRLEQGEMPGVEGAHGRDEPDRPRPQGRERVPQLGDCSERSHLSGSSSATRIPGTASIASSVRPGGHDLGVMLRRCTLVT